MLLVPVARHPRLIRNSETNANQEVQCARKGFVLSRRLPLAHLQPGMQEAVEVWNSPLRCGPLQMPGTRWWWCGMLL